MGKRNEILYIHRTQYPIPSQREEMRWDKTQHINTRTKHCTLSIHLLQEMEREVKKSFLHIFPGGGGGFYFPPSMYLFFFFFSTCL